MKDILVFARNFNLGKEKWGFKWCGFCNGKKFIVLCDPYAKEISFDSKNGMYIIGNYEQRKLLPANIYYMLVEPSLSNEYFILGKELELTTQIVLKIIESGYNIDNIYMKRGTSKENFLCRYINKENGYVVAEILKDHTIIWKGELE